MNTFYRSTPHVSWRNRKLEDVTLGIVHYTGSMNLQGTLSWFEDKASKVSAHYVIGRNGDVYQYNTLASTLWHAGRSEWNGRTGCNSFSIGYELVGTYDSGFTDDQMNSLESLLRNNVTATGITAIVGHEHVSPGRKVDPGPEFSWDFVRNCHHIKTFTNNLGFPVGCIGGRLVAPPATKLESMESGRDCWKFLKLL